MESLATVWLPLALAIVMFSLGLGLSVSDFQRLVRRPKPLVIGVAVQMVGVPALAYAIVVLLDLPRDLALGMMILAVCPGGAASNVLTRYVGGDVALSISLTGLVNLASIFTVPLLVAFFADRFIGIDAASLDVTALAISMFNVCAIPVIIGLLLRHFAPRLTRRIEGAVSALSHLLFAVIIAAALALSWTVLGDTIGTLAPALLAFAAVLLATAFATARLFRASHEESIAIAIEAAIQNTTMGLAVAAFVAERAGGMTVLGLPSGAYGIMMYLVCVPVILSLRQWQPRPT
ncbi:MAG: bile acid:sodium symporter family protein [Rhizobiaceae bacterium]|nr:bile acid:sodium symporter family protein [Rhizobiaceae bacterium]